MGNDDIGVFGQKHRGVVPAEEYRLVIADDIELIHEGDEIEAFLRDLLGNAGYELLEAENGAEALTTVARQRPDLILMDIQLPEVSGLEVTKWLKEDDSLKAIPVVAVTAFAMKGDEEVIRQGGCEAYISKPISVTSFLDTVRRFIG